MTDSWARTLYERYVQLYGDPIEQPLPARQPEHDRPLEVSLTVTRSRNPEGEATPTLGTTPQGRGTKEASPSFPNART